MPAVPDATNASAPALAPASAGDPPQCRALASRARSCPPLGVAERAHRAEADALAAPAAALADAGQPEPARAARLPGQARPHRAAGRDRVRAVRPRIREGRARHRRPLTEQTDHPELRRIDERLRPGCRGLPIVPEALGHRIAARRTGPSEPVAHRTLLAFRPRAAAGPPVPARLVDDAPLPRATAILGGQVRGARPHLGGREQASQQVGALLLAVLRDRRPRLLRRQPQHHRVGEGGHRDGSPGPGEASPAAARERLRHVGSGHEAEVTDPQLGRVARAERDRGRPLDELDAPRGGPHRDHGVARRQGRHCPSGHPREDEASRQPHGAGDGRERVRVLADGHGAIALEAAERERVVAPAQRDVQGEGGGGGRHGVSDTRGTEKFPGACRFRTPSTPAAPAPTPRRGAPAPPRPRRWPPPGAPPR